ncbi:MAG: FliA/WhiG family RNA polymerase sigma factor [Myxococcales bacterium]|nr:FliA/WhiG family RNA polymerase sigma factor [Myxococcales bacterium]
MSEVQKPAQADDMPETVDRNTVIERYAYLVNKVAYRLLARLPANVELDDLKSAGVIGLIDAAEKFDASKSNFRSYAEIRIRGAILDELRALDWVPRTVRQSKTNIERARRTVTARLGRPATDDELADELGLTPDEFAAKARKAEALRVVSYEDLTADAGEDRGFLETIADPQAEDPETTREENERRAVLLDAMQQLDERSRLVVGLYYFEDMSLRDIGSILGVTESRISQIHSKAVRELHGILGGAAV